jgi:hypothetical protein
MAQSTQPDPLLNAPFVQVEGIVNMRRLGGYPIATSNIGSGSDALENVVMKPGIVFRSGEPSKITPKGKDQLLGLGIRKVFDLRSEAEIASFKSATPEVEGVVFEKAPVIQEQFFDDDKLTAQ